MGESLTGAALERRLACIRSIPYDRANWSESIPVQPDRLALSSSFHEAQMATPHVKSIMVTSKVAATTDLTSFRGLEGASYEGFENQSLMKQGQDNLTTCNTNAATDHPRIRM